jgi:L-ascorbate metabolism protein UlaG (beta-lactamase superfamily)
MRKLCWCLTLCAVLTFGTAAAGPPVAVQYIANEGFLIDVGPKKILIDALFDDETITYAHVPDASTLEEMGASQPPFDEVDLVLVTHSHRDHFGIGPVFQHFTSNSSGILVGPPQMTKELGIVDPDFEVFGERVREIDLAIFDSAKLDIDGIDLQAFRLPHSAYMETDPETGEERNRHAHVENLVYLFEVDGVRFLHVGDAVLSQNPEFFEDGHFTKQKIDVLFLEFFDWSDETRAIIDQWMTPGTIVFMHLPPQPEKIEALRAHLEEKFPEAFLFSEPLQVEKFDSSEIP